MSYANQTSTTNYIDALNFGTSAETTSTLGDDRVDTRIPPDQYHTSGLQITRIKALVLGMSQYLAGGNRLRVLPNAANQFAAGEYGYYLTTTLAKVSFNGATPQTIAAGVMAAKGDILSWTGSAWNVLTVGADGTQLTASAAAAGGIAWSSSAAVTSPVWTKVNKTFTNLAAAATTNDIEVYSLPAGGIIHAVKTKHSTAFSGGAIASYTLSVGIVASLAKYSPAFDVFQAVSGTTFQIATITGSESHTGATSIRLAATSTGANLDQAAAGVVDVWLLVSTAV